MVDNKTKTSLIRHIYKNISSESSKSYFSKFLLFCLGHIEMAMKSQIINSSLYLTQWGLYTYMLALVRGQLAGGQLAGGHLASGHLASGHLAGDFSEG